MGFFCLPTSSIFLVQFFLCSFYLNICIFNTSLALGADQLARQPGIPPVSLTAGSLHSISLFVARDVFEQTEPCICICEINRMAPITKRVPVRSDTHAAFCDFA